MCHSKVDLTQVSTRNLSFELGIDLTKYAPLPNENTKDHKIAFAKTIFGETCSCRDVYTLFAKGDKAFIFHTQDCYINEEPNFEEVEGEEEDTSSQQEVKTCDVRTVSEKGEIAKKFTSKTMKIILSALGESAKELFGSKKTANKYKATIREMRARLFPED